MNTEKIAMIIYYDLIPVIIGFFFFSSLGRVTDVTDFIRKMIIFLMYIIPISLIYVWIGRFIFSRLFPRDIYTRRLMIKMISCKIRKENGNGHCVTCPDSFSCITSVDDINKVDKIKGDVAK